MNLTKISKFLSLVLRHHPEKIDLKLDEQGWASVKELIVGAKKLEIHLDKDLIEKVVRTNDKQRFSLSPDGQFIRASQGHSVEVSLGLEPKRPPTILYHGTASKFIDAIKAKGLVKGQRNHIHLSENEKTPEDVGGRHGKPVILQIKAEQMYLEGKEFYLSDNKVWLTEDVPVEYIIFPT